MNTNVKVIRRTIHLRNRNVDNSVTPKGGATITCEYNKESGQLDFAIALCSKKDVFSKSRGRLISESRLNFFMNNPEKYLKLAYSSVVPKDVRFINVISAKVLDLLEGVEEIVEESEEISNLQDFQVIAEVAIEYSRKQIAELHPTGY